MIRRPPRSTPSNSSAASDVYKRQYKKDTIFINTTKFQKGDIDLPFWWYLRKVPMSDDTLNALSERADISRETLLEIQKQGFTLVRTDDIEKRRSLTLILGEHGITL